MGRGFAHGDGWVELLWRLCEDLEPLVASEVCGQPGTLREDTWIKTLCDKHDANGQGVSDLAESTHEQLWQVCQRRPGDYEPYGKRKRLAGAIP
jgi:hypothetical protein